ncbi:MAG: DUF6690 family protein [Pirellulaceae bacterium]
MQRTILFLGILLVAALTPMFLARQGDSPWPSIFQNAPPSGETAADDTETVVTSVTEDAQNSAARIANDPKIQKLLQPNSPVQKWELGGPIVPLPTAVDFGLTPSAVNSTWPRVSSQLAELDLRGLRVPLVTGTEIHDLHGSATYYFDRGQQLVRITLHGYTGDPGMLMGFLQNRFSMRQMASTGPTVMLSVNKEKKPLNVLLLKPASALSESRDERHEFYLELNHGLLSSGLSAEMLGRLSRLHEARML